MRRTPDIIRLILCYPNPFHVRHRYDQFLHANVPVVRLSNSRYSQQILSDLFDESAVIVQVSAKESVYI